MKNGSKFVTEQILSNALKYTKNGGEIRICLEEKRGRECLVIEDNGIGIQAEDLPRVFEKGFTGYNGRADKKSTGIGLYLCKKIMDKMGHKIWIDSEVGKGTRVYLELTRKEWNPEEPSDKKRKPYRNVRLNRGNVTCFDGRIFPLFYNRYRKE